MTFESLLRSRNRLHYAWEQRRQMCKYYEILRENHEARIETQQEQITRLEIALAKAVDNACEE